MKIIALEAENFKIIKALRIEPVGAVQVISGRNAQGKSAVLDIVDATLCGAKASPEVPIRRGADSARTSTTLDDGTVVTRTWTEGGKKTRLKVTRANGDKAGQEALDPLFNHTAFDPMGFVRAKQRDQADIFRQMSGLDLSDLDRKRTTAYDERTQVNRIVKQQEGQLAGMPEVDAPDEETSMAELLEQQRAAMSEQQANDQTRRALEKNKGDGQTAAREVERLKAELTKAEAKLATLRTEYTTLSAQVAALQDPDIESINGQLAELETTNRNVRAKRARAELVGKLKANRETSDSLTAQLDQIDTDRAQRLEAAAAKLPVPGLSLEGDTVTLNGVPLTQASSAEQIRTGLAISAALNPKLRVALIRDGSLIDPDGMTAIQEWAEANETQVFIERVSTGSPVGVVIEDGEVVEAQSEAKPKLAAAAK